MLPLLCEVLDDVDVPVLAAGGIADARGVAAVLAAGASGVRIGTRFIATEESAAHSDYVAAILAAGANSTRITDAFNDCPLCASSPRARVLISAIDAVEAIDVDVVGTMRGADGEMPVPRRSWLPPTRDVTGHIEAMAMYAGESVALVNTVLPASQLVRSLAQGAEALMLQRLASNVRDDPVDPGGAAGAAEALVALLSERKTRQSLTRSLTRSRASLDAVQTTPMDPRCRYPDNEPIHETHTHRDNHPLARA
jgi:hypothetical protein